MWAVGLQHRGSKLTTLTLRGERQGEEESQRGGERGEHGRPGLAGPDGNSEARTAHGPGRDPQVDPEDSDCGN